jgi:hypothetical protein
LIKFDYHQASLYNAAISCLTSVIH